MADINALIAQGFGPFPDLAGEYRKARIDRLKMKALEQEIAGYPEEKNWQREKRGMERTKFQQEQQLFEEGQQGIDFKNYVDTLSHAVENVDSVNYQNYPQIRSIYVKRSPQMENVLPPVEFFEQAEPGNKQLASEFFDYWKKESLPIAKSTIEKAKIRLKERELEQGKAGDYQIVEREDGTYRVNKLTGESTKIEGIPGKPAPENTPQEIRQFEMETGVPAETRGTEPYMTRINRWRESKREPREPKGPSDFEKKWDLSAKIAREKSGREPTLSEIADVFKSRFVGSSGVLGEFDIDLSKPAQKPKAIF